MHAKTSGSSGDTLTFVADRFLTRQREKAFIWNLWSRVGYKPGDRIANFRGDLPKPGSICEHNRLFNTFIFSSFDLNKGKIGQVISTLNNIKPDFLHGYPSTIVQLIRLMQNQKMKILFLPKAVFCGSEKMFPNQRKMVEDIFGCRAYTWYGHSEYAVLGGECEQATYYHLFPQYGFVEFLPTDIRNESSKKFYEIVGTGFSNWVMPFIRYKTGDYALLADSSCKCGRNYPLIEEVVGRSQEFLVDCTGNLVSATALVYQFEKIPFIEEYLFIQDCPGKVLLCVLPNQSPSAGSINEIEVKILQATQSRIQLKIELVQELPKTPSGKRLYVDQRLNLSKYLEGGWGLHELQHVSSTNDQATRSVTMIQTIQKNLPSRALKPEGKFHWLNRYLFDLKAAIFKGIVYLPNRVNFAIMSVNRRPLRVFGGQYMQYRRFLSAHYDGYDAQEQLLTAVNKAIEQFPYYRGIYGKKRITSLCEFENEIGFIDKNIILQQFSDFIHPAVNRRDYDFGTTGGTSGRPLQLIVHKNRFVVETATMHSLWERAGYRFDVRAVIRNHKLERNTDYLVNPITREVIFDGFRLNPDYFETIYTILQKHKIAFIHCYPSHAYEFALFLLHRKLDISFIKAFLSGSENIFEYQTDLIQNRLGIRFYNWYGHSEKLVLAGHCDKTNDYHIEPTYGYFELINEKNEVIRTPGAFGEIVGTSFHNPGMFFLRYRTGDYAEYVGDRCSACGSRFRLYGTFRAVGGAKNCSMKMERTSRQLRLICIRICKPLLTASSTFKNRRAN